MEPTEKDPAVDQTIKDVFGLDRKEVITSNKCAFSCESPNLNFRNEIDRREYSISGICQSCQDNIFGSDE